MECQTPRASVSFAILCLFSRGVSTPGEIGAECQTPRASARPQRARWSSRSATAAATSKSSLPPPRTSASPPRHPPFGEDYFGILQPPNEMRDFLTEFALAGAAILFAAWLLLVSRRRLAWAADRIAKTSRSAIAVFLFFVTVATVCAQKSGTNEPPRGVSSGLVESFDGRVSTCAEATADKEHVERVAGRTSC